MPNLNYFFSANQAPKIEFGYNASTFYGIWAHPVPSKHSGAPSEEPSEEPSKKAEKFVSNKLTCMV